MRILLATIGFVAWLTLPASAQGQCLVGPGADGRPLSFQQWYGVCGAQVDQLCNYMSSITPVANCRAIATAQYQQYFNSIVTNGGQPPCSQYNAGQPSCINGWWATCDGNMWQRSYNRCGG